MPPVDEQGMLAAAIDALASADEVARDPNTLRVFNVFKWPQQFVSVWLQQPPGPNRQTLKDLSRRGPRFRMGNVPEGVYEPTSLERFDWALQPDSGLLDLRYHVECTSSSVPDPQVLASPGDRSSPAAVDDGDGPWTAEELLRQLAAAGDAPPSTLLCKVELTRFEPVQQERLLPLLWRYVLAHRDSNRRDDLVGAGAAIRKYIAIMPMARMGELAVLLESGHKYALPIDLEIEVAKMVFRNFEVHPPQDIDTQPELAARLLELAQAYVHPRILLRDKHSAAASLAIEAMFAMRSSLAAVAWQAAVRCPYRWFAELVSDNLDALQEKWSGRSSEAAAWLGEVRGQALASD